MLYSGIACIVDLIVKEGLINLDFADVRAVMKGMGSSMMGTGEGSGEDRADTSRPRGDRRIRCSTTSRCRARRVS